MHETTKLLYEAARLRTGVDQSPAQMAKLLNVSEQVITNWSKRGISVEGALKAQSTFRVDANYLLKVIPAPQLVPVGAISQSLPTEKQGTSQSKPDIKDLVRGLANNLKGLDNVTRRRIGPLLNDLVEDPENHESLATILIATIESGKQRAA